MNKNEKSFAFTLAEALLTITIIGVTMTLMMRGINRVNPDREKIMFVKTYHAMEHIIANIINDPTKYDPNYYSDEDLEDMTPAEKASLHSDFSYSPLNEATVTINGQLIKSCGQYADGVTPENEKCIDKGNAICYFLADAMNTVGTVDCENEDKNPHFKTTTGVCVNHVVKEFNNDGYIDIQVNMASDCQNLGEDYSKHTYAIRIFRDGKMSVPETHTLIGARQATAYNWMNTQTEVK